MHKVIMIDRMHFQPNGLSPRINLRYSVLHGEKLTSRSGGGIGAFIKATFWMIGQAISHVNSVHCVRSTCFYIFMRKIERLVWYWLASMYCRIIICQSMWGVESLFSIAVIVCGPLKGHNWRNRSTEMYNFFSIKYLMRFSEFVDIRT